MKSTILPMLLQQIQKQYLLALRRNNVARLSVLNNTLFDAENTIYSGSVMFPLVAKDIIDMILTPTVDATSFRT